MTSVDSFSLTGSPPSAAAVRGAFGDLLPHLPLFPLGTVLFPQGLLALKIFEARYLDLITHCLRSGAPFGVVTLRQGTEIQGAAERCQSWSPGLSWARRVRPAQR